MAVNPIIGDVLRDFGMKPRKPIPPCSIIVYPDGPSQPGVEFRCANGFVSRAVGAVAEVNIPDAERVCAILNAHFANGGA